MGPAAKPKLEMLLERDGLAAFLRQLADEAQSGTLMFPGGPVGLAGMKALKIGVKDTGQGLRAKVRVKFPRPGEPRTEHGATTGPAETAGPAVRPAGAGAPLIRPRYKALKKRMKQDFKDIGAALAAGFAPNPAVVASFLADSRLMTTYRGKGDASYPDYLAALAAFETAAASGDPEAMVPAYRELAACKKQCHDRHA